MLNNVCFDLVGIEDDVTFLLQVNWLDHGTYVE